jgi:hypothetical protein
LVYSILAVIIQRRSSWPSFTFVPVTSDWQHCCYYHSGRYCYIVHVSLILGLPIGYYALCYWLRLSAKLTAALFIMLWAAQCPSGWVDTEREDAWRGYPAGGKDVYGVETETFAVNLYPTLSAEEQRFIDTMRSRSCALRWMSGRFNTKRQKSCLLKRVWKFIKDNGFWFNYSKRIWALGVHPLTCPKSGTSKLFSFTPTAAVSSVCTQLHLGLASCFMHYGTEAQNSAGYPA